jgi:dTDP-4-amino-4,6-dideoxygalactose transaminase
MAATVRSFADCGRRPGEWFYAHFALGGNDRMTEWQAAVLLAQLDRFDAQHRRRNQNALMLNGALTAIPGVHPQVRDARTTAQGYYCYVVRLDSRAFGAPRDLVERALEAEGLPLTRSYPPVHDVAVFAERQFGPRIRDRAGLPDYARLDLPESRRAAAETIWFRHQLLLGEPDDASAVAEALAKIRANIDELRALEPPGFRSA